MARPVKTKLSNDRIVPNAFLSLDTVKLHLNVINSTEFDALISLYMFTSVDYIFGSIHEDLGIPTTYQSTFTNFDENLELEHNDIDKDTVSITYLNSDMNEMTLSANDYIVDDTSQDVNIIIKSNDFQLNTDIIAPITVNYTTNDGATNENIVKSLILISVKTLWDNRTNPDYDMKNDNMLMNKLLNFIAPITY